MIELEAIPWQAEAWEAEWRGRGGGGGGGGGGRGGGGRGGGRAVRQRYGRSGASRRRRRRPWIFGPWSAAPPWIVEPWTPPVDTADDGQTALTTPAADQEPAEELEAERAIPATLTIEWGAAQRLERPDLRLLRDVSRGGGVYLEVGPGRRSVYVGEAGNLLTRWIGNRGHLWELRQMGLPQQCCAIEVYFGTFEASEKIRRDAEAAIIRTLRHTRLVRPMDRSQLAFPFYPLGDLMQTRSTHQFRATNPGPGVHIQNVLPRPICELVPSGFRHRYYDRNRNRLAIPPGAQYELE